MRRSWLATFLLLLIPFLMGGAGKYSAPGGTSRSGQTSAFVVNPDAPPGPDPPPPPPPQDTEAPNLGGITVVASSTTSTLITINNAWDAALSYPMEKQVTDENSVVLLSWTDMMGANVFTNFTSLTEGQTYCYRVQIRDNLGNTTALTDNGAGPSGSDCVTLGTTATEELHDAIDSPYTSWDVSRDDGILSLATNRLEIDTNNDGDGGFAVWTGAGLPAVTTATNVGAKALFDEATAGGADDANLGLILGGDCSSSEGCFVCYVGNAYDSGALRCEERRWTGTEEDVALGTGNCEDTITGWYQVGNYLVVLREGEWGSGDGVIKAMDWAVDPCSGSGCATLFDQYTFADCSAEGNCSSFVSINESECSTQPTITTGSAAGIYARARTATDAFANGDWAFWEHDPETVSPTTILSLGSLSPFSVTIGQSTTPPFRALDISNTGNTGTFGGTLVVTAGGTCPGASGDVTWISLADGTFSGVTTIANDSEDISADAAAGCTVAGQYTATITATCTTGDACTSGSPATRIVNLTVSDPVQSGSWPDVEDRCDSLGSDCYCSETLDANEVVGSQGSDRHDPAVSVTKECPGLNGVPIWWGGTSDIPNPGFISVSQMTQAPYDLPALPAGSIAQFALVDSPQNDSQLNLRANSGITLTDRTWCQRYYIGFGDGFLCSHTGSQGDRCKLSRNVGGTPDIHHETELRTSQGNARFTQNATGWGGFGGAGLSFNFNTFTMAAVEGQHWVRIEHCYDHEPDDELNVRVKHVILDGSGSSCTTFEDSVTSTGTNSTFYTGNNTWIIDGYRLARAGGLQNDDYNGFLGAMAANVSYDPTFWIGGAIEVEGGTPCD